ncbi:hypothetical protein HNP99_001201 [Flavobacterium sp. 28A]|uniref:DUF3575 domain-containing protein n=1 Tax=Flavobacterium sp. 28A TaxID=2735895 RepID=UPI0015705432|nr:DUF3575 domain-containing protein [Flavobacterium sp. 28A]NRT14857.1 hypothetical protein [Flavobacterium sp. 28A]
MKTRFCLFLVLMSLSFQAQKPEGTKELILNRKNELRIDIGKLILNSRIQLTYEYFIKNRLSVGVSAMIINGHENTYSIFQGQRKYQIDPFVRYSFSNNSKSLFYAEFFSSINGGSNEKIVRLNTENYGYYDKINDHYIDVAIGPSVGYKVYIAQRFPINFNLGLGFNLFNNSSPAVLSRVGLSTGYRF